MKHEWRKHEKNIYIAKKVPMIVDIPTFQYIELYGEGNPNGELFSKCIEVLYALSYGIKMTLKKNNDGIEQYEDYTVYPLEALWDLNEEGRRLAINNVDIVDLKDYFTFRIMIRQPGYVTQEFFKQVKESAYKKKNEELIKKAKLISIDEGCTCQILHIGSYDDEPESFKKMEEYLQENDYERLEKIHREIYLSDARKVSAEKLKTSLRIRVKKI